MSDVEKNTDGFKLKSIAELLKEKHVFVIPSYQRGYRWESVQVEDLLKDICDFAMKDKKDNEFYCLQPIVVEKVGVKKEDVKQDDKKYIVIDGQQRLTTLLLIINYLKEEFKLPCAENAKIYEIQYATRHESPKQSKGYDFNYPQKDANIDSFHVFQAKLVIENWFGTWFEEDMKNRKEKIEEVLFLSSTELKPKVAIIWYVTNAQKDNAADNSKNDNAISNVQDDNATSIESIKTFNNLNKGKIPLTNAELIKALFILKAQSNETEKFAYEWNDMENALYNDNFWYFLTTKDYNAATRIDIIFDLLTGRSNNADVYFAYRTFQALFDDAKDFPYAEIWKNKKITNFPEAWEEVKKIFHTFVYWYEDNTIYHYIGYLINDGDSISEIYNSYSDKSKSKIVKELIAHIRGRMPNELNGICNISYSADYAMCKRILLLFNIETCVKQSDKLNEKKSNPHKNNVAYYRFPFDLYQFNSWDIEHVHSQTGKDIVTKEEKIKWLQYICDDKSLNSLLSKYMNKNGNNNTKGTYIDKAIEIKNELGKLEGEDDNDTCGFKVFYKAVYDIFQPEDEYKDTLGNLALLDSSTNRGYGNAFFTTKRAIIIKKDKIGVFIPPCTKNIFLKYYTNFNPTDYLWTEGNSNDYLAAIVDTLGVFYDIDKQDGKI